MIGKLRHKVIIQQLTGGSTAPGTRGQSQKTWADKDSVQASVEALNGRELEIARGIIATVTHKVEMYYTTYAIPRARLRFDGRYLNVESVIDLDGKKRKMQLLCTEEIP